MTRSYYFHVPVSYDPAKAVPLVIVLHPEGANARSAMRLSQMNDKSDREGFIAIYPDGTGSSQNNSFTWNAWNCCGSAVKNEINDVGFIREMIERLGKEYSIDQKKIFATGFSNGGMMVYRLALELSDKIAAIAPIAAPMNIDKPEASYPVSVIAFHGSDDQYILYEGGSPKKLIDPLSRIDKPATYGISFWAHFDQCKEKAILTERDNIIRQSYVGGTNGTEVVLYTIRGQGHAWPGSASGIHNGNLDEPTKEISATDLMWEFFAQHPKPDNHDKSPYSKWVRENYV